MWPYKPTDWACATDFEALVAAGFGSPAANIRAMTRKRPLHAIPLISVVLLAGILATTGPGAPSAAAVPSVQEPDWLAGDEAELESEPNSPGADWMFVQRRGAADTVPGA